MSFEKQDNGQLWIYGRPGIDPGFVVCEECGASVPNLQSLRDKHDEWHERLRRAVDENGTLG